MDVNLNDMVVMKAQGKTYQEIGDVYHLSRQRIQQKFEPKAKTKRLVISRSNGKCDDCGATIGFQGHIHHKHYSAYHTLNLLDNLLYLCTSCHRKRHGVKNYCKNCQKEIAPQTILCAECYYKVHHTKLVCSQCGKEYELTNSENKARIARNKSSRRFCSHKCQGVYVGKHHKQGRISPYNKYIPEIALRHKSGERLMDILKELLPNYTISTYNKISARAKKYNNQKHE